MPPPQEPKQMLFEEKKHPVHFQEKIGLWNITLLSSKSVNDIWLSKGIACQFPPPRISEFQLFCQMIIVLMVVTN